MMMLLIGIVAIGIAIVFSWGADIDAQAASRIDVVRRVRSNDSGSTVAS